MKPIQMYISNNMTHTIRCIENVSRRLGKYQHELDKMPMMRVQGSEVDKQYVFLTSKLAKLKEEKLSHLERYYAFVQSHANKETNKTGALS